MRSAAMKFTGMLLVLLAALIVAQTPTAASEARSRDWTIQDGRLYVDGEWVFLKIGKPLCNFADPAACQKLGDTLDTLQAKGFNALELNCYWHHFDKDADGTIDGSLEPLAGLIDAIHARGMFPCLSVETYGVGGGKIPDPFWKRHPEAIAINAEGKEARDLEYGFKTAVPSLLHQGYRDAVHAFIRALVAGLPHRKILFYETTVEPQFMGHQDIDYSANAKQAYEAWLTKTGIAGPAWPEVFPVPGKFRKDPVWLRFRAEALADWVNGDAAAFREVAGKDAYIAVDYLETCNATMPRRNGDSIQFLEALTCADIIQVNWHWRTDTRGPNECAYRNVWDVKKRLNRNWAISEHMTLNGSDYQPADVPAMLRNTLAKGTGFGWDFVNVAASTGAKFALYNDDWSPKPLMAEVDDHWPEWQKEIAAQSADAAGIPKRPNILFIFSDDHAQHALSCYGSKVNSTPHLDRLASTGARFTNSFVTNSICSPSRATLLTGQYSHANGVPVFNAFDGSRDHVAKHLQRAGYHTGMVGKWHLGTDPTGFDRWIVLPGQGSYQNPSFLVPGGVLSIDGHCTDIATDLGIEFLATRPRDKPFFLMLHHKAPHREWEPDERNKAKFKDAVFPEPATLFDDYATRPTALPSNKQTIARDLTNRDLKREPPAGLAGKGRNEWLSKKPDTIEAGGATLTGKDADRWKYQQFMRDYLACVQGVDDSVGRMLDFLDRQGLADDTIVIYSTDNGWYLGDLGLYDKRFMYEPGLKTPLLARGPGIRAGITPEAFVANIDLAPTFLDLAGVPVPEWMQGRSLVPILRGETPADWRKSVYYRYYHDPGDHNTRAHYGVRTKTHKLIHYFKQGGYELFDLVADPHEQHNLLFDEAEAKSPQVAALFADLKAELERLQREYGDDGRYVDPATWPPGTVNGPFPGRQQLGKKTVAEAIAVSPAAGPSSR